jgi:hypothetical protein
MMNLIQSSSEEKLVQQAKNTRERQKRYYDANKAKMAEVARKRYEAKKQLQAAAALAIENRLEEVKQLSQWYNFNCDEAIQRLNKPLSAVVEPEEEVFTCSKPFLWTPVYVAEQIELIKAVAVPDEPVAVVEPIDIETIVSGAETSDESASPGKTRKQYKKRETPKGCRELSKCLVDGQRVRTAVSASTCIAQLEGSYDAATKKIAHGGKLYSLNQFAELQIETNIPLRGKSVNAWSNCMCEINGKFVKMTNLPVPSA